MSYDELCKALFPAQDWDRLHEVQKAATFVQARNLLLVRVRGSRRRVSAGATTARRRRLVRGQPQV